MIGMGIDFAAIRQHVATCNYVSVAQLFLQKNTYLRRPLSSADIKPRLLGHWGTCPGINFVYANLQAYFADQNIPCETDNFAPDRADGATSGSVSASTSKPVWQFILGPGHGFPALQANLWLDGVLERTDARATRDEAGLNYLCRNFCSLCCLFHNCESLSLWFSFWQSGHSSAYRHQRKCCNTLLFRRAVYSL